MNICIYGSASDEIDPSFIRAGEALGEAIAKSGHGIVFGGGARGMMGAVARGVARFDGTICGIAPRFFNVDGVLFDNCTEMVYTADMHERKKLLEDRSDAFIVTPGGIGTYDELFETLCLRQLEQHKKPILLFNVNGYFDPLMAMLKMTAKKAFMSDKCMDLLLVESDPEKAIMLLTEALSIK
ncbi:MAG: TIGR00730 family Rossman fold protein [Clostridia bacterium]|nr:TIGR00730 family Rossman fold protein [Clostridia bacterium]